MAHYDAGETRFVAPKPIAPLLGTDRVFIGNRKRAYEYSKFAPDRSLIITGKMSLPQRDEIVRDPVVLMLIHFLSYLFLGCLRINVSKGMKHILGIS